jgi:hypothetical protein
LCHTIGKELRPNNYQDPKLSHFGKIQMRLVFLLNIKVWILPNRLTLRHFFTVEIENKISLFSVAQTVSMDKKWLNFFDLNSLKIWLIMEPNSNISLQLSVASNPPSVSMTYIMLMSDLYQIVVMFGKCYDGKGMGSNSSI